MKFGELRAACPDTLLCHSTSEEFISVIYIAGHRLIIKQIATSKSDLIKLNLISDLSSRWLLLPVSLYVYFPCQRIEPAIIETVLTGDDGHHAIAITIEDR